MTFLQEYGTMWRQEKEPCICSEICTCEIRAQQAGKFAGKGKVWLFI